MVPKLSIVFTSYNHREYLRQAIESILGQTYKDFELIIVDDCSTDGSQLILQEYEKVENVRLYLQKENSGSYVKASNFGASQAKGEYLLFAQCDDFAELNQISTLMASFNLSPSIGVSFCRSNLVDEQGEIIGDDFNVRESSFKILCVKNTIIQKNKMRSFLAKSCVIPNLSAAIIKRDLYIQSNGLSEKYIVAADWAFWLKLTEYCDFFYVSAPLNNFRQHKTTIRSTVKIKRQVLEIYDLFYSHMRNYSMTHSESQGFRIGAGSIWLSYFSQGPKSWLISFPGLIGRTFIYEKFNLWYLVRGFFYKIKEYLKRKIS